MSPQAEQALASIRARLASRSREADLWDMSGRDERLHLLRKSYRQRRAEGGRVPVPRPKESMADRAYDDLTAGEQNIVTVACHPIVAEAERIARNGLIVS